MAALFGLPLCGSCFVPLVVAVVTLLFYCTYFLLKSKNSNSVMQQNAGALYPLNSDEATVKEKPKKKKKKCNKKRCCSDKKGSGACSTNNGSIDCTKIFLAGRSTRLKESASMLMKCLAEENLTYELVDLSDCSVEETLKLETDRTSLCTFLVDATSMNTLGSWLEQAVANTRNGNGSGPLSGMKYAVFLFQQRESGIRSSPVDRWLHKLGAVRVRKAESADPAETTVVSDVQVWCTQLLNRINKWNAPSGKACKCGTQDGKVCSDGEQGGSCSGSSTCSGSDMEEGHSTANGSAPVLDVEDIARILDH